MSRLLHQIHRDHRNAARLLELLEAYAGQPAAGTAAREVVRMLDIMRYMTDYPDRFHHPIEDLVMERLCERDPSQQPLVADLSGEHEALAERGRELLACLRVAASTQAVEARTVHDLCRDYVDHQRYHMRKEEALFLPEAQRALSTRDWAAVAEHMALRPDPLFGADVQAEYEALLQYINLKTGNWARAGENLGNAAR